MLRLGQEFSQDDELSQYWQETALESRSRLQSFFIGKINRLGDWVRAGGKTKDNAGILTAGETDGFPWRMQKEGEGSAG